LHNQKVLKVKKYRLICDASKLKKAKKIKGSSEKCINAKSVELHLK